jgi:hypothetical protein
MERGSRHTGVPSEILNLHQFCKMALLNQNMNQAIASTLRALHARSATDPYLR